MRTSKPIRTKKIITKTGKVKYILISEREHQGAELSKKAEERRQQRRENREIERLYTEHIWEPITIREKKQD